MRTSSPPSSGQALAWQTTSRSRGLVSSERSQKVSGSAGMPSETKKFSAVRVILSSSQPCSSRARVMSNCATPGTGSTSS
jgi:hypothetical protein